MLHTPRHIKNQKNILKSWNDFSLVMGTFNSCSTLALRNLKMTIFMLGHSYVIISNENNFHLGRMAIKKETPTHCCKKFENHKQIHSNNSIATAPLTDTIRFCSPYRSALAYMQRRIHSNEIQYIPIWNVERYLELNISVILHWHCYTLYTCTQDPLFEFWRFWEHR